MAKQSSILVPILFKMFITYVPQKLCFEGSYPPNIKQVSCIISTIQRSLQKQLDALDDNFKQSKLRISTFKRRG